MEYGNLFFVELCSCKALFIYMCGRTTLECSIRAVRLSSESSHNYVRRTESAPFYAIIHINKKKIALVRIMRHAESYV